MTRSIILIILFVVVVAYINFSRYQRLIDEGQIIKRSANFEETAEIFTISNASWKRVWEELRAVDYHGVASVSKDAQRPLMVCKGAGWGECDEKSFNNISGGIKCCFAGGLSWRFVICNEFCAD